MKLNKILFATVIAMCTTFVAKAQLEIKPTVGLNLSKVSPSDGVVTTAKIGYQIGASAIFGRRVYLSPGIYYCQHTTQYVFDIPNGTTVLTAEEKIAGIKIPVLLGVRIIDPETDPIVNVRVFAGPSILFNTKNSFSDGFGDDEINWKSNSWGAQVGAGIDIAFVFVEVGYEFGLTKTSEWRLNTGDFEDPKHDTFILNAGLRFEI